MLVSEQPPAGRVRPKASALAERSAALAARQSAIDERLARRAALDDELRLLGYRDVAAKAATPAPTAPPRPGQRCLVCGEVKPIVAAGLAVDLAARRATYRGEPIRMGALQVELLALLLRRPGRWVTAEALSQAVYGLPYAEMRGDRAAPPPEARRPAGGDRNETWGPARVSHRERGVKHRFCGLCSGQSKLLGRLNAPIKDAMAGRAQNPEHVPLVLVHRAPATVSAELGTVGKFEHAGFSAPLGLTDSRQIGVALAKPRYKGVSPSLAVVRALGSRVGDLEAGEVRLPRGAAARIGAMPLVWADRKEVRLAGAAGARNVAPVIGRAAAISPRCGSVSAAPFRAISRRLVPGLEPLATVQALARVRVQICSHATFSQNRLAGV